MVPVKVNAPKASTPVTSPVPTMVLPVIAPDPVPTVPEPKSKITLLPEIVPEAVPVSVPIVGSPTKTPTLVKPMLPVPLKADPVCEIVALKLPPTALGMSYQVPDHVPTIACEVPPVVLVVELDDVLDEAVVVVVVSVEVDVVQPVKPRAKPNMGRETKTKNIVFFFIFSPPKRK